MNPGESNATGEVPTHAGRDMVSGGILLCIGALLFLITIGIEQWLGWPPPEEVQGDEIAEYIQQLWPSLQWVWSVQLLGGFLFGLSALLILRSRNLEGRWITTTVIWSSVAVGSITLIIAYGLSLGGYPPAFQVLEDTPQIFQTFRGAVRFLLILSLGLVLLGYHVVFIGEAVSKSGVVPRHWLIGAVAGILLAIMGAAFGQPTVGVVAFLIPVLLGLVLWRAGRQVSAAV